jgi:hypothetical protein
MHKQIEDRHASIGRTLGLMAGRIFDPEHPTTYVARDRWLEDVEMCRRGNDPKYILNMLINKRAGIPYVYYASNKSLRRMKLDHLVRFPDVDGPVIRRCNHCRCILSMTRECAEYHKEFKVPFYCSEECYGAEHEGYGDPDDRQDEEEMQECPEHGMQLVKGHGSINPVDPYSTSHLACGDTVCCFGPGDPNSIVGKWKSGDLVPERYR